MPRFKTQARTFRGRRAAVQALSYADRFPDKQYKTKIRFAPGGTKTNPNYRVTVRRRGAFDF